MTRDPLLPTRRVDGGWTTEGAGSASLPTDAPPSTGARNLPCDPYPPPPWATVEIGGQTLSAKVTYIPPQSPHAVAHLPPLTSGEPRFWAATFDATTDADDWREFVEVHNDPVTVEHNAATGEALVSFNADVTSPGEAPIPVRAVVTWTPPRRIFAAVALDGSGVWAIGDSAEEARDRAVERRGHLYGVAERVGAYYPPPTPDAAWLDGFALVTLSGTTESLRALVKSMETGDPVAPWCPSDLWDSPSPTKEP